jgi:hypothetical protein
MANTGLIELNEIEIDINNNDNNDNSDDEVIHIEPNQKVYELKKLKKQSSHLVWNHFGQLFKGNLLVAKMKDRILCRSCFKNNRFKRLDRIHGQNGMAFRYILGILVSVVAFK